jgi:hypothetical protein
VCRSFYDSVGLGQLLEMRTTRRVKRENHREVWGPRTSPSAL